MFNKSIKTVLAAGILAIGTAATATAPAQAGGKLSVYIGGGHGTAIHYSSRKRGYGHRHHVRRAKCAPRRALNKAYRYGLNRPHIQRINNKRIVVSGWNRGHQARIVFKRNGGGCQIIRTRGI